MTAITPKYSNASPCSFTRPPSENRLLGKLPKDLTNYIHACLDQRSTEALFTTSLAARDKFANPPPKTVSILRFSSKRGAVTLEELKACGQRFCSEKKFSLDLSNSNITDDELGKIISRFPNIREINLGNCRRITNIGFGYLHSLTQLFSLDLSGCNQINSSFEF